MTEIRVEQRKKGRNPWPWLLLLLVPLLWLGLRDRDGDDSTATADSSALSVGGDVVPSIPSATTPATEGSGVAATPRSSVSGGISVPRVDTGAVDSIRTDTLRTRRSPPRDSVPPR